MAYVMEHALIVFAVWALWQLLATQVEAGEWFWIVFCLVLGLGAQLLIDWDQWYLGLGMGGAAVFLMRVADLLLVTTDWIRVSVLRNRPPR